MKLVSEKSEKELDFERADRRTVSALRELAANILRCAAGHGKDYLLPEQCVEFVLAVRDRDKIRPVSINAPYHLAASTALKDHRDWIDSGHHADCAIRDAAMQIHASYLLDQMTQVSNAENRMRDAIRCEGYERKRPPTRL